MKEVDDKWYELFGAKLYIIEYNRPDQKIALDAKGLKDLSILLSFHIKEDEQCLKYLLGLDQYVSYMFENIDTMDLYSDKFKKIKNEIYFEPHGYLQREHGYYTKMEFRLYAIVVGILLEIIFYILSAFDVLSWRYPFLFLISFIIGYCIDRINIFLIKTVP